MTHVLNAAVQPNNICISTVVSSSTKVWEVVWVPGFSRHQQSLFSHSKGTAAMSPLKLGGVNTILGILLEREKLTAMWWITDPSYKCIMPFWLPPLPTNSSRLEFFLTFQTHEQLLTAASKKKKKVNLPEKTFPPPSTNVVFLPKTTLAPSQDGQDTLKKSGKYWGLMSCGHTEREKYEPYTIKREDS